MRSVTRHNSHARSVSAQIRAEEAAGVPLEIGVRRALERCFDLDLSAIRVHANPVSDRLTR